VAAAVDKALEKLAADRFETAKAFADALADRHFTVARGAPEAERAAGGAGGATAVRRILPWVVAAVAVSVALFTWLRPAPEAGFESPVFAALNVEGLKVSGIGSNNFAVSADGRSVAFAVDQSDEGVGLAVRSLGTGETRYLKQTVWATLPFWSPDGKFLGFVEGDSLKAVELATGTVRTLCPAEHTMGGTWAPDGTILFSRGTSLEATRLDDPVCSVAVAEAGQGSRALHPQFLGDGRHFIATGDMGVWLGELGSDSLVYLRDLWRHQAVLAPPDYLLWNGGDRFLAQRIDTGAGRLVGEPVPILARVPNPGSYTAASASANGVLVAALPGGQGADTLGAGGGMVGLVERDRGLLERLGVPRGWGQPRISRDGRRLALGGWNVNAMDLASRAWTLVGGSPESGQETAFGPLWAPGDTAVFFVAGLSGRSVRAASTASGLERTVSPYPFQEPSGCCTGRVIEDLSADGRRMVFSRGPTTRALDEVWEYDLEADTVHHLFDTPGAVWQMRYDPRGRWLAYTVSAGGRRDVFVRPYNGPGAPVRVSAGVGGWMPAWRADGSELFYMDATGNAVAVAMDAAGPGNAEVVVPAEVLAGWMVNGFDVSPDGRRFAFVLRPEVQSFSLVLGWERLLAEAPS
jgi:serine/threonine-protein kinase